MKFDGMTWTNVGYAGFTVSGAEYTSLAFSPSGKPCLAFNDDQFAAQSGKISCMEFDGLTWLYLGNPGFSTDRSEWTCLVFSPFDENPYVAYRDFWNNAGATVMKFDGSNWAPVGNEGFSKANVGYPRLAVSPTDDHPYVSYEDGGNSWKATVMKFNGVNWVNIGNPGFSAGISAYPSLAFSQSGQPYVAYADGSVSDYVTVMKYDSVFVGQNEVKESRSSLYPNPTSKELSINVNNIPGVKCIEIDDLKGITLFETQTNEDKIVLDVRNYPFGIYLVKVKTGNSNWIGKFCKD